MKDDFRDPNSKYLKLEEVLALNIPYLCPIEISLNANAKNDIERGNITESRLVYYASVAESRVYDSIEYYQKLVNGSPCGNKQSIMLPLIESIIPLNRGE